MYSTSVSCQIVLHLALSRYLTGMILTTQLSPRNDNTTRLPPQEALAQESARVNECRMRFVDEFHHITDQLGHQLKVEETFVSHNAFMYGKEIFYEGTSLSCTLKKCGKIQDDTNDILSTLADKVATIHTGGACNIADDICTYQWKLSLSY